MLNIKYFLVPFYFKIVEVVASRRGGIKWRFGRLLALGERLSAGRYWCFSRKNL